jgi:hypothetical protein
VIELHPNRDRSTCSICRWTEDAPTDNVVAVRFGTDGGNGGQAVNLCPDHRRQAGELLLGEDHLARFLVWRGIADPCLTCSGVGTRPYGSTSTWRGGMGGQMITSDVCDTCWGSGDRFRIGTDLRRLRDEESKRVAAAAVDLLARAAGATLQSSAGAVREIVMVLREAVAKADRGRGKRAAARESIWFGPLAKGLADVLERALVAR